MLEQISLLFFRENKQFVLTSLLLVVYVLSNRLHPLPVDPVEEQGLVMREVGLLG